MGLCLQSRPWLLSVVTWMGQGLLGSHDMKSKKETSRPLLPKHLILEINAGGTGTKRRQLGDLEVWEAQGSFLQHKHDILKIH